MSTVNPLRFSSLEIHDPYYLPSPSRVSQGWHDPDSEIDEEEGPRRGRDTSARSLPNLHSRSVSPANNPFPLEFTRRKSTTVYSTIIQAHHTLPSISSSHQSSSGNSEGDGLVPSDPVLYLPPLLSPLPASYRGTQGQKIKSTKPEDLEFATRLPNIDPASLVLHQALHNFRPLDQKYSTTEYDQAFNWSDIVRPPSSSPILSSRVPSTLLLNH